MPNPKFARRDLSDSNTKKPYVNRILFGPGDLSRPFTGVQYLAPPIPMICPDQGARIPEPIAPPKDFAAA